MRENRNKVDLLCVAALLLVGLGARLWLLQAYATPLPYWDQWQDTQTVFSPYYEGKLQLSGFFVPNGEHRIPLTRVYNLALLLMNGQWDNLPQAVANVFFYVGALTIFAWLLARLLGRRFWPLLALLFMTALALPYTWENTLYGYDSQYYFLVFFSLLTVWLLGFHKPGSLAWWGGLVATLCALLAMTAGLLAAASVITIVLLRLIVQRWSPTPQQPQAQRSRTAEGGPSPGCASPPQEEQNEPVASDLRSVVPTLAVCVVLVVIGLAMKGDAPWHEVLKAQSVMQFLVFLGKCLAWPWIVLPLFAIFNLFPLMLLAWIYWRDPRARGPAEGLILGIGVWEVLQALATAYTRGNQVYPQWRYMDGLCFIMIANALSLALLATRHREQLPLERYFRPCAGLWTFASVVGVILLCGRAWQVDLPLRDSIQRQQLLTTRAFLATGERQHLQTRWEFLPRPAGPNESRQDHAQAMIDAFNQPHIRQLLPACAREPLPVRPTGVTGFLTNVDVPAKPAVPGEAAWSSFAPAGVGAAAKGRFESQPIPAPKLAYLEFRIAGDAGQPGLSLKLTALQSGKTTEIKPRTPPGHNWQSYQVKAPAGEFTITASDDSSTGWLAFQPPREVGWLSWLSARLMASGKWVCFAGLTVYAAAIALVVADRRRKQESRT